MIENELKADPQYKASYKAQPKADKKAKPKGASSLVSSDKDLNSLEKAWSETASEMKAMQKTLQDITTCIGHLQQNRSPQPIPPTNNVDPTNQGNNNTQTRRRGFYRGRGGRNRGRGQGLYQDRPPFVGGARTMLVKKKPNIEFRTVLYTKNVGELVEDTPNQLRHHHS